MFQVNGDKNVLWEIWSLDDFIEHNSRAAPVAQRFSAAFSPGPDPGPPGSLGVEPASPSGCVSASLCVCLS